MRIVTLGVGEKEKQKEYVEKDTKNRKGKKESTNIKR